MENRELIRKLRHNIYLSGIGVILLGFWCCVKIFISVYLSNGGLYSVEIENSDNPAIELLMLIMTVMISVIIMAVHLFVGVNAMKAGKKTNPKKSYLIVAGLMALSTATSIPPYLRLVREDLNQLDVVMASFLVDSTFIFILFDIIYSSIRIEKITKIKKEL